VLKKVLENKPFRGPDNFKQGDFEYFNKVEGVVENFQGEEAIFYKKQLVYKLNYHGGLVIRKNLFYRIEFFETPNLDSFLYGHRSKI
ncbi:hypothetical protein CO122_01295, partial [bacterium (Candidatus Gribaldobacteria) CG_4_9_14_3_um_filter_33_9]